MAEIAKVNLGEIGVENIQVSEQPVLEDSPLHELEGEIFLGSQEERIAVERALYERLILPDLDQYQPRFVSFGLIRAED